MSARIASIGMRLKIPATHEAVGKYAATLIACGMLCVAPKVGASMLMTHAQTNTRMIDMMNIVIANATADPIDSLNNPPIPNADQPIAVAIGPIAARGST